MKTNALRLLHSTEERTATALAIALFVLQRNVILFNIKRRKTFLKDEDFRAFAIEFGNFLTQSSAFKNDSLNGD